MGPENVGISKNALINNVFQMCMALNPRFFVRFPLLVDFSATILCGPLLMLAFVFVFFSLFGILDRFL
jgi:hypothetical protein